MVNGFAFLHKFTHSHTHSYTGEGCHAICQLLIWSNLKFSILLKMHAAEGAGILTSDLLITNPLYFLSYSRPMGYDEI